MRTLRCDFEALECAGIGARSGCEAGGPWASYHTRSNAFQGMCVRGGQKIDPRDVPLTAHRAHPKPGGGTTEMFDPRKLLLPERLREPYKAGKRRKTLT